MYNDLKQDEILHLAATGHPKRQQLDAIFTELVGNGFNRAPPYSSLAFWSGEWAKFKAEDHGFITDLKIPVYTAMLGFINHGMEENTAKLMRKALFTHYASEARGHVAVFTSRPNELKSDVWNSCPFLVAHNYFWDVELPVLFTNYRLKNVLGKVNGIDNASVSFVVTNPSTGALELKPRISLMKNEESDQLRIVNRNTLIDDGQIRPSQIMTMGKLRQIAKHWRSLAQSNQAEAVKTAPQDLTDKF